MGTMADAPGSLVMRDLGSSEVSGLASRVCVKPAVSTVEKLKVSLAFFLLKRIFIVLKLLLEGAMGRIAPRQIVNG